MRTQYQQSLETVRTQLIELADLTHSLMSDAAQAFVQKDVALSEEVLTHLPRVETLTSQLDELSFEILALQQPVATDLRFVLSAMRMSVSFSRMADLCEHLAQLTQFRYPERVIAKGLKKTFARMAQLDVTLAATVAALLRAPDHTSIVSIADTNAELHQLRNEVFRTVLDEKFSTSTEKLIDATLASRYFERFGDHCVAISRQIDFFLGTDPHREDTPTATK